MDLGKLAEVNVRELWRHEQYDFSNWLAKSDNIEYLSDILGLTLTEINKEVYVGSYRCDLVARDEATDTVVIIENQLECSNHDHLGKIITYASGLDAKVVVWIVTEAREEHRSAIEWLNNNTNKDINFFIIELHAYRIGDSLPAPMFEVVEQPNGFIKVSKNPTGNSELNKTQAERLAFWTEFNNLIIQRGRPFNTRKATTDHWYDVAVGTSEAHISIDLIKKDSLIIVELYINNNKDLFDKLFSNKEVIENELGFEMIWTRLNNKKASRIKYYIPNLNFEDHSNYPELMNDTIDKVIVIKKVFSKYI